MTRLIVLVALLTGCAAPMEPVHRSPMLGSWSGPGALQVGTAELSPSVALKIGEDGPERLVVDGILASVGPYEMSDSTLSFYADFPEPEAIWVVTLKPWDELNARVVIRHTEEAGGIVLRRVD